MTSESFSRPGAVDLSGLAAAAGQPAPGGAGGAAGGAAGSGAYVVEATEQNFQQEVVERSVNVPVVLDFWATWCEPCKQLSPILERLSTEYAGRFVLATIDVDQNPRLAQAAGVQSIPLVVAVVRGQIVPLFQGAVPEAQVRQYVEELLRVATANGVSGRSDPVGAAATPEAAEDDGPPGRDPRFAEVDAALGRNDLDAAITEYEKLLDRAPGDPEAKSELASTRLLRRTRDLDPDEARALATAKPDDVQAQCAAADLEVMADRVDDGFARLVEGVRRTTGDDRNALRVHLLELFDIFGTDDPRVRKARQALSTALF